MEWNEQQKLDENKACILSSLVYNHYIETKHKKDHNMKATIIHFIKMLLIVLAFFGMFAPCALAAQDTVAMALVCFTGIIMFAFGLFDVVHTYKLEKNPAYGLK